MAPPRARRGQASPEHVYELGVQGRKTGVTLQDKGVRDEHGMEPVSGIFSSPAAAPAAADVRPLASGRKSQGPRPAVSRGKSPIKTYLKSPAVKNPHLPLRSSPIRGSIVAPPSDSSSPRSAARRLEFTSAKDAAAAAGGAAQLAKTGVTPTTKINGVTPSKKAQQPRLTNGHAAHGQDDKENEKLPSSENEADEEEDSPALNGAEQVAAAPSPSPQLPPPPPLLTSNEDDYVVGPYDDLPDDDDEPQLQVESPSPSDRPSPPPPPPSSSSRRAAPVPAAAVTRTSPRPTTKKKKKPGPRVAISVEEALRPGPMTTTATKNVASGVARADTVERDDDYDDDDEGGLAPEQQQAPRRKPGRPPKSAAAAAGAAPPRKRAASATSESNATDDEGSERGGAKRRRVADGKGKSRLPSVREEQDDEDDDDDDDDDVAARHRPTKKKRGPPAGRRARVAPHGDEDGPGDSSFMRVQRGPPLPRAGGGLLISRRQESAKVTQTRSGRNSIRPLEYWKGERVVYEEEEAEDAFDYRAGGSKSKFLLSTIREVVRVDDDADDADAPRPKKRGRPPGTSTAQGSRKGKGRDDGDDDDYEGSDDGGDGGGQSDPAAAIAADPAAAAWEIDPGSITGEVFVWEPEHEYNPPSSEDVVESYEEQLAVSAAAIMTREIRDATFKFAKTLSLPFFGAGVVDLPPGAEKKPKNSRKFHMCFFVFQGRVKVTVNGTDFSIGKGGMWFVPRGNYYSILNERDRTARVFFAQGCEMPAQVFKEEDE